MFDALLGALLRSLPSQFFRFNGWLAFTGKGLTVVCGGCGEVNELSFEKMKGGGCVQCSSCKSPLIGISTEVKVARGVLCWSDGELVFEREKGGN